MISRSDRERRGRTSNILIKQLTKLNPPVIMKFGGTSVEDARAFGRVALIVAERQELRPVVVVSAISGMTDALLSSVGLAIQGDSKAAASSLDKHFERHIAVAHELLGSEAEAKFSFTLDKSRLEIEELLVSLAAGSMPARMLEDIIASYGERLSASLLASILSERQVDARYVDARRFIITDGQHGRAVPIVQETNRRTRAELDSLGARGIPVLGGFIGATTSGETTTLGRGGSDYTAALVGAALAAREIQIWTDVAGVLTADPRIVPEARTISRLSYAEAAELAYFGAKVLHPNTIQPAVEQGIPVRVCNSREPDKAGTLISGEMETSRRTVKAIAHKNGITIVQVTSARMLGAYGFLHALFEIFNRHRKAVDVVTTSEVSVSLSIDDTLGLSAIVSELQQFGSVRVDQGCAMICVVGRGMSDTPGIAAKIFGTISDINVSLISQGASSINLTFVVAEDRVQEAVGRLHQAFFETSSAPSKISTRGNETRAGDIGNGA